MPKSLEITTDTVVPKLRQACLRRDQPPGKIVAQGDTRMRLERPPAAKAVLAQGGSKVVSGSAKKKGRPVGALFRFNQAGGESASTSEMV